MGSAFGLGFSQGTGAAQNNAQRKETLDLLQKQFMAKQWEQFANNIPLPDAKADPDGYNKALALRTKALDASQKVYSPEHHATLGDHIHGLIFGPKPEPQATPIPVSAGAPVAPMSTAPAPPQSQAQAAPAPDHPFASNPAYAKILDGLKGLGSHLKAAVHPLPPPPPGPSLTDFAAVPNLEDNRRADIAADAANAQKLEEMRAASAENLEKERSASAMAVANVRANASAADKPAVKPLETGGVPYGVQAGGKTYLASQMSDPSTPQEATETWATIQDGIKKKQAAADQREREIQSRFLQSQANIASRMGRSEEFQALMSDFREQESVYKGLDVNARNTQSLVDTYKAQYAQPGNYSATDTALTTDYTSVLAKGGRKTQAEIKLAQNIGSFRLNWQQKLKKATTGELPEELRNMYLQYMEMAAKTQRKEADQAKPDLPSVAGPGASKSTPKSAQAPDLRGSKDPLGLGVQ